MSGPNVDLFVRVLAQIEKHPETWDQKHWAVRNDCGTAYCLAGWACALSGYQAGCWMEDEEGASTSLLSDGDAIPFIARQLLEIPGQYVEGENLFSEDNTLDDLYRLSAKFCGLDEQVLRDKVAAEVADGRVQP